MGKNRAPNFDRGWVFKCLYTYLLFSTLIESFNGFFIYENVRSGQNIIVAIKLLVFLFLFVFFISKSIKKLILASFVIIAFLVVFSFQVIFFPSGIGLPQPGYGLSSEIGISGTVQISVKIMLNLLAANFIIYLFREGEIKRLRNIAYFNNVIIFLNFLLALAGVGFDNYNAGEDVTFGGTGFFYAGNELGVAMIFGAISMLVVGGSARLPVYVIVYCFLGALALLSKTALLGAFVISVAYVFFNSKKTFVVMVAAALFFTLIYAGNILEYFRFALNRWMYFIDQSGLFAFLLGGEKRVFYSSEVFHNAIENPLYGFFGGGWTGYPENNFFDLVDGLGALGFCLFVVWGRLVFMGNGAFFRYIGSGKVSVSSYRTVVVASFLVFAISIFAGHTVQSSLIIPFVGFLAMKKESGTYI